MDEHSIEGLPPPLIGVETLIEEMPEKTAGLRNTEGDPVVDRKNRIEIIFGVRDHVPDGCEAESHESGIRSLIHQFIDVSGFESPIHGHPNLTQFISTLLGSGVSPEKPPAISRYDLSLR